MDRKPSPSHRAFAQNVHILPVLRFSLHQKYHRKNFFQLLGCCPSLCRYLIFCYIYIYFFFVSFFHSISHEDDADTQPQTRTSFYDTFLDVFSLLNNFSLFFFPSRFVSSHRRYILYNPLSCERAAMRVSLFFLFVCVCVSESFSGDDVRLYNIAVYFFFSVVLDTGLVKKARKKEEEKKKIKHLILSFLFSPLFSF